MLPLSEILIIIFPDTVPAKLVIYHSNLKAAGGGKK